MENCNCHNEIILKGSGQLERYLKALDPSYVSIDGRSMEDLLVFAAGYAEQIRFYDMPDSTVDDPNKASWSEFFKRDMAVIAASIATVDLDRIKKEYDDTNSKILANPSNDLYASLFNQVAAIAIKIDQWYSQSIPENPLYTDINLAIKSSLSSELKKAIAYEEGFIVVDSKTILNIDYSKILNQDTWGLNDKIDPEFDIYEGITPEDKILNAVPYVDDVFHAFLGVITNIVEQSTSYIEFALTQYPAHQPYMALFIAFLKLFNVAQQQMNGLTGKMLDFYYRDVLHLAEKPSVPDKAFVVFELAKNVAEYDLAQGTALSAGKDVSGKEQVYKTENDFVVNQASVKELKNIFILKSPADADEAHKEIGVIYANPVANSKDGYGEKFTVPEPKWPTFGNSILSSQRVKNICEFISKKETELSAKNTAAIGFAVASPQLVLQGGNRLIKIGIAALAKINSAITIKVALTGEKGWLNVDAVIDNQQWLDTLTKEGWFDTSLVNTTGYMFLGGAIYVYLPVSEQGIVPFNAKLHTGHSYDTKYPVAQVLIGPQIELPASIYKRLRVSNLSIAVQVGSINLLNTPATPKGDILVQHFDGLKKLVIQNDVAAMTPGKAFDPFTATPSPGTSFYIGSDEVFNKPLGKLALNISKTQDDISFGQDGSYIPAEYNVSVLHSNDWMHLVDYNGDQFSPASLTFNILNQYLSEAGQGEIKTKARAFPSEISIGRTPIEYFPKYDIDADKGFLRVDNIYGVNGDGNSGYYNDIQSRLNLAPQLQIKSLSVSYISNLTELDPTIDQFFHVYPFGTVETYIDLSAEFQRKNQLIGLGRLSLKKISENPLVVDANDALLPQFTYLNPDLKYKTALLNQVADNSIYLDPDKKFPHLSGDRRLNQLILESSGLNEEINGGNNQYSADFQEEGQLFIGLQNLQPLQTLSLLFQFADGSAIDEDNDPPLINWSYLVYNEWRPLKAENLISDSTYGFQTTGIVKLDVPGDINSRHTIITDGLYWFSASVCKDSRCIPQLIDVVAQATEVQFFDQNNSQLHFDNALAAGTINKLSVAVAQVSKVTQPFASFDGKHKEVGKEYYTRVSERLRHKRRAVTSWDYEHLVLDRFPNVFKVKCIPTTDPGCICRKPVTHREHLGKIKCCGPVSVTGHVLIVPVPNLKNNNAVNPLQPKTGRLTLIEISDYLSKVTSPFVKVHARNPVYEQVIVFFRVKFLSGVDKGYYLKKLNDEIVQYLTPWAFDETIEAEFGQKIYASAVINFIEQRPYVDFITDFLMGVCRDECCPPKQHNAVKITEKGFIAEVDKVSGCSDIEVFLKDQGYFIGDVIAKPSSQMSLLVSAPKHIILLYDEPVVLTPCEKRLLIKKPKIPVDTLPPVATYPGGEKSTLPSPAVGQVTTKGNAGNIKVIPNLADTTIGTGTFEDKVITAQAPVTADTSNAKTAIKKDKEDSVNVAGKSTEQVPATATASSKDEIVTAEKAAGKATPIVAKETTAAETPAAEKVTASATAKPSEMKNIEEKIEGAIDDVDKILKDEAALITTKGKATVKKAEDFLKNVVKGTPKDSNQNSDKPGNSGKDQAGTGKKDS
ncbi:hypothetical protein [Mucilaginibacter xinganensis]|uniref:Baseplate protein J-like domain-containing protein n=1 Tax=Mucilaginibacter xinganensis TaxID=1234841 RepID=A0A223NVK0_9SPHI|nr:hypothetical protein [Mucilaginibacter xinganensis]ASU33909.1 hypothetical protein MuYL_2017 [Mucilaginibacter xinganensis]